MDDIVERLRAGAEAARYAAEELGDTLQRSALDEAADNQAEAADTIDRQREALRDMIEIVESFHAFCRDPKRPCGEYGAECPISMGEWIDADDTAKLERARSALSDTTRGK